MSRSQAGWRGSTGLAEHPQSHMATRSGPDPFHALCKPWLRQLVLGSPWHPLSRDAPSFQRADSAPQVSAGRCYLAPASSFHPSACLQKCSRVGLVWYSNLLSSPFGSSKGLKRCCVTPWCGTYTPCPKELCLQAREFNLDIVYNQSTVIFLYIWGFNFLVGFLF